jgi:PAS domain S-box-containing protein
MSSRILVVEDEAIIASGITRKLSQLGYTVVGNAGTGEAAVRMAGQTGVDLILMDIKLEGRMDGIAAAAEIKRRFGTPVVFLTAYADEATLEKAKVQDPFGYLVKPFTDRELYGTIEVSLHRHQLERALREREERYRMLSELISDFAFSIAVGRQQEDDRVLWTVGKSEPLFGVEFDTVSGFESYITRVHPEDVFRVRTYWETLRKGGRETIEYRVLRKHEEVGWIKQDGRGIMGAGGRIDRVYTALQDITALRSAEKELAEREFELSQVVQVMQQGVWVGDAEDVCIYANPVLCRLTGYDRDEIVGQRSLAVLGIPSMRDTEIATDQNGSFEAQIHRNDGSLAHVMVSYSVTRGDEGEFKGQICLIQDITRQHQTLELLTRAQQKLEGAFHASPTPSLLMDTATNTVLDVNDAFCELTGFTREEITGVGGFGLADFEDLEDLNRMIAIMKGRVPRSSDVRLKTKDGEMQRFTVDVREIVVENEGLLLMMLEPDEART